MSDVSELNKEVKGASVHVINKFKVHRKNQAFQCLMIYQDLETEFCFVKPLLAKDDVEISMELLRIFTMCGPPDELQLNSCSQVLVDAIEENMNTLCPIFKINYIKKEGNKYSETKAMKIVQELHKWSEETNKEEWEIGCAIVQRKLNAEKDTSTNMSPQDRLYKKKQRNHQINLDGQPPVTDNMTIEKPDERTSREKCSGVSETSHPELQNKCKNETSGIVTGDYQQKDPSKLVEHPSKATTNPAVVLNCIKVKQEDDSYLNSKVFGFEGGVIFPGLRNMMDTIVEVKMERLDDY